MLLVFRSLEGGAERPDENETSLGLSGEGLWRIQVPPELFANLPGVKGCLWAQGKAWEFSLSLGREGNKDSTP